MSLKSIYFYILGLFLLVGCKKKSIEAPVDRQGGTEVVSANKPGKSNNIKIISNQPREGMYFLKSFTPYDPYTTFPTNQAKFLDTLSVKNISLDSTVITMHLKKELWNFNDAYGVYRGKMFVPKTDADSYFFPGFTGYASNTACWNLYYTSPPCVYYNKIESYTVYNDSLKINLKYSFTKWEAGKTAWYDIRNNLVFYRSNIVFPEVPDNSAK